VRETELLKEKTSPRRTYAAIQVMAAEGLPLEVGVTFELLGSMIEEFGRLR